MKKAIFLAAALLYAPLAAAVYKCVDEKGLTRIGDTPPDQCANVVMYEMTPNGKVLRKIDPTPSADALKQVREEEARKREADKQAAVQKRKDEALLSTYANEKEFDVARDRNIDPIRGRIRAAQERLKVIDARQAKITEEMEFYQAGKKKSSKKENDGPPPMLVAERESLEKEKASVNSQIERQQKEIEELKTRYESDRKRWLVLKSGTSAAPAQAKADPAAAATQAVRKTY